jgi:cell wall-associated NlpC family hydrolase
VKRRTLTLLAALVAGTVHAEDNLVLRTDPGMRFFVSPGSRHLANARELALQALAFVGIRYKYGGSSPDTGFDCSGLVRYVASQALGLMLPRDSRALSAVGAQVRSEDLQPGDLVFFNTLRRSFSHVGIYVGDQRFIHAPASGGSVELVDMREPYWHRRYDGARRLGI